LLWGEGSVRVIEQRCSEDVLVSAVWIRWIRNVLGCNEFKFIRLDLVSEVEGA